MNTKAELERVLVLAENSESSDAILLAAEVRRLQKIEELSDVCPFDCDSCHDEDCPCDRMGCAGDTA